MCATKMETGAQVLLTLIGVMMAVQENRTTPTVLACDDGKVVFIRSFQPNQILLGLQEKCHLKKSCNLTDNDTRGLQLNYRDFFKCIPDYKPIYCQNISMVEEIALNATSGYLASPHFPLYTSEEYCTWKLSFQKSLRLDIDIFSQVVDQRRNRKLCIDVYNLSTYSWDRFSFNKSKIMTPFGKTFYIFHKSLQMWISYKEFLKQNEMVTPSCKQTGDCPEDKNVLTFVLSAFLSGLAMISLVSIVYIWKIYRPPSDIPTDVFRSLPSRGKLFIFSIHSKLLNPQASKRSVESQVGSTDPSTYINMNDLGDISF